MTKKDKRTDILRAGLELIAEQGFHGASMSMIAEQAGVAAGTLYLYFESKDTLIRELYRDIEDRVIRFMGAGYSSRQSVRERFIHLGSELFRYLITHPLEFRYIEQFHYSPYGATHRRDRMFGKPDERDIVRTLFDEGVAAGVIKNLPLPVLSALAFGPMLPLVRDSILGFVDIDDRLIKKSVAACWDAIERRPARAGKNGHNGKK